MLTFGPIAAYQSGIKFDSGVSDDKRAITLTFSDFQATVGGSKSKETTATRVFTFTVPLQGDDKRAEIEFLTSAGVATLQGATATLISSVNGQTIVNDFPANTDQSFEQTLKFSADRPSECRLCVILLISRDSKNADAEAFLNALSIDIEILPRPKPPRS
jgi:hypothetical protein